MSNYTVLHLHSDMSNGTTNIDSVTKFQEYIDRAAELGMTALAFSEHGACFAWDQKKECIEKAGMKYIHAAEFYVTEKIEIDDNGNLIKLRDNWHCLLIAKNLAGVKEINKLASKSFNRKDGHYYYAPRIEFSDLISTSENVIISTACFRKGTPVLTNNGYIPIENIKAGDIVINQYGKYETVNFPTQREYNGIGYRIDFIGGKHVECTANHEFLTFKLNNKNKNKLEWISAKNLNIKPGSEKHICVMSVNPVQYSGNNIIRKEEWQDSFFDSYKKGVKPRKYCLQDEIMITPEIMRLFGLFLGDGHISLCKNPRIGITFNINEYEFYWDSFIKTATEQLGIKWSVTRRENYNRVDITSSSVELIDLFYYLFGNVNATNKHIPNRLKHISKELDIELFFGYMLADGYFRAKKFSKSIRASGSEFVAASVSFDLISGMKDILDSLHITAGIRKSEQHIDRCGVNHNDSWYLYSRAYDIGSISKLNRNTHAEVVKIFNNAIQKFEDRDYIIIDNILYKKIRIKNKMPIELNETVYCLNNNTHSFVCNGVIVHNCLGGILNRASEDIQKRFLNFMIKNKHRCFLEIQHHDVLDQKVYNQKLYNLSKKYGLRLVAGTDTHSLNSEHADGRRILQLSKNIHFGEEDGWDLTFKSYNELCDAYKKQGSLPEKVYLEAIETTNVIANMVEPFEIDRSIKYPRIYENSLEVFKKKINDGYKNNKYLQERYSRKVVSKRFKEELAVYEKVGAIDFMLLQSYIREWERENGVQSGYGRGSVSGSLIAYALGVTQMDSLKFDLNFFRFLNPDRVTNSDVDTDYSSKDREKLKYFMLHDKLNLPHIKTSEIITFNTIATKGAIKDVCRALNISLEEAQSISDAVNIDGTIDDEWRKKYSEVFKYVDIVSGTIVSIGSHPSGVLVSDRDIEEDIGLCSLSTSDYPVSMLDMKSLDAQMYVKEDVLGLDNIGVINETCRLAGIDRLTPDNVDLDDDKVWRSIKDDTTLIFQWESNSAQAYLKKFMSDETIDKVKKINKGFSYIKWFSFGNGLLRPACASYRDEVADGVFYDNNFKELNEFLAPEMGRVCMQETIMQFMCKFCGYSQAESDNVRRAIAKKKGTEQLLPEIERRFIEYSSTHYDITKERCQEVIKPFLQIILDASSYGLTT